MAALAEELQPGTGVPLLLVGHADLELGDLAVGAVHVELQCHRLVREPDGAEGTGGDQGEPDPLGLTQQRPHRGAVRRERQVRLRPVVGLAVRRPVRGEQLAQESRLCPVDLGAVTEVGHVEPRHLRLHPVVPCPALHGPDPELPTGGAVLGLPRAPPRGRATRHELDLEPEGTLGEPVLLHGPVELLEHQPEPPFPVPRRRVESRPPLGGGDDQGGGVLAHPHHRAGAARVQPRPGRVVDERHAGRVGTAAGPLHLAVQEGDPRVGVTDLEAQDTAPVDVIPRTRHGDRAEGPDELVVVVQVEDPHHRRP